MLKCRSNNSNHKLDWNKFKWTDAKYLYETFEIKKRGPFQIDASGGISLQVKDNEGVTKRIVLRFRALLIGDKWALVEGVRAELDPLFDSQSESSSKEEATVEEVDDGDY